MNNELIAFMVIVIVLAIVCLYDYMKNDDNDDNVIF
jgi:hypothetical protein